MKLEYTGDATIRYGTDPIIKGGHIEVDEETGLALLARGDFKKADGTETILDVPLDFEEEEES